MGPECYQFPLVHQCHWFLPQISQVKPIMIAVMNRVAKRTTTSWKRLYPFDQYNAKVRMNMSQTRTPTMEAIIGIKGELDL